MTNICAAVLPHCLPYRRANHRSFTMSGFSLTALFTALSLAFAGIPASAADNDLPPELQGLGLYEDILPIGSDGAGGLPSSRRASRQQSIIPFITSSLPKSTSDAATYNIANAEQVFCYHVAKKPKGFTGYTLNNFAVTGYCGELDIGATATTYEALFTQSPNIITAPAACTIEPRVMLRFVRGVDYTDVLLSSPCPSFTIFYAGRYTAFNIKQGVIDDIISQFDKENQPFNSPALLKKTVANGVADTDKEAEAYEKKQRENAPVMNWKTPAAGTDDTPNNAPNSAAVSPQARETSSGASKPAAKGWGNIKLRM